MGYFIKQSPTRGMVTPVVQSFQTDAVTPVTGPYTMGIDYGTYPGPTTNNPANILVFLGGIYQTPTTDYTISGTALTLGTVPPADVEIRVVHDVYSTDVPSGSEF